MTETMTVNKVLSRMELIRQKLGWHQSKMASYLGLAQSTISRIERRRNEPLPVSKLLDILEQSTATSNQEINQ